MTLLCHLIAALLVGAGIITSEHSQQVSDALIIVAGVLATVAQAAYTLSRAWLKGKAMQQPTATASTSTTYTIPTTKEVAPSA